MFSGYKKELIKKSLTVLPLEIAVSVILILGYAKVLNYQVLIYFCLYVSFITGIVFYYYSVLKTKRRYCAKCKEKFDIEKNVSYKFLNHENINLKRIDSVEVQCICDKCKERQKFLYSVISENGDEENFMTKKLKRYFN